MVWQRYQNVPVMFGEASPAGYNPGKRSRCRPRIRWRDCISDLAWFRLSEEPAE